MDGGMKILYMVMAAVAGVAGAAGVNMLLNGTTAPAAVMHGAAIEKAPGGDEFASYQRNILAKMAQESVVDGLPAPEMTYAVDGCVIRLESKVWQWQAEVDAQMQAAMLKFQEQMGGDATKILNDMTPERASGQKLFIHAVERFDLRTFDLTTFKEREKDGYVWAYAQRLPFAGGDDPTNRAVIDAWVEMAETPEEAEEIRQFGKRGRVTYKLNEASSKQPDWNERRETFRGLAEGALASEGVTNMTVGRSYSVLADGTRDLINGNLGQPKHVVVFAANAAEAKTQVAQLRDWKAQNCR